MCSIYETYYQRKCQIRYLIEETKKPHSTNAAALQQWSSKILDGDYVACQHHIPTVGKTSLFANKRTTGGRT